MIVNGHLAYTSRLYHVNHDLKLDWKTAYEITHAPETKRGGAVSSVDGDQWFVTLFGAGGDVAPTDEDGFLAYATSLACPDIAEIIKTATPASQIYRVGNLRSRWNRFHKVPNWPQRPARARRLGGVAQPRLRARPDPRRARLRGPARPAHRARPGAGPAGLPESRGARQRRSHGSPRRRPTWAGAPGNCRSAPGSRSGTPAACSRSSQATRRSTASFIRVSQMVDHPAALFRPGVLFRCCWEGAQRIAPSGQRTVTGTPRDRA